MDRIVHLHRATVVQDDAAAPIRDGSRDHAWHDEVYDPDDVLGSMRMITTSLIAALGTFVGLLALVFS